ncbi:hypothetical protein LguiB_033073 [Lonicera macranthoides]
MRKNLATLCCFMIHIFLTFLSGNSNSFPLAPALYVFGDSLLDNGNNNLLPTIARANYKPYGFNFDRGATGRFTNGRTVADFIEIHGVEGEYIGLPFSPPYLSIMGSVTKTGLNFASAACGILPETGYNFGKCFSFAEQLDLFQETVEKEMPKHFDNFTELSDYLSKSIFVIGIGNNDYINNYLQPNLYHASQLYTPQSFAKHLTDSLSQHFQRLYDLGGRKVVVFEIGPIGCIPSVTRKTNHIEEGKCVEEVNKLAILFNNQLHKLLTNLTSSLKGSNFIIAHSFNLAYDAILNPSSYAPALYVFGDSLLDNGNNNLLPTITKANFKPYGLDFDGGATGRFTNGKTTADFMSEYIGLPFSPPYLSLTRGFTKHGLNFASAGCGILPETGYEYGKCLNFAEQVDLFQRTVKKKLPKHFANSTELSYYLSKSIFVISIGNNDFLNNYIQPTLYPTSKLYDPQSFAQHLTYSLSQQFQRLYKLGARKVVVFDIGPIGCIPTIVRTMHNEGKCVEEINHLAIIFNNQLKKLLINLTSSLKGSKFIIGHTFKIAYDAIVNPSSYGLKDTSNPCCIAWNNGTLICVPDLPPCANRDEHYFWDGYHVTQTIYSTITTRCINDSSICTPMSIKELLQV